MKIALLGAPQSGKTVYLSALYYKFRNAVTLPPMTTRKEAEYARFGVKQQVGFRFSLNDLNMEQLLADNAANFFQQPIRKWPEPTNFRNKVKLAVTYEFVPIAGSDKKNPAQGNSKSYSRDVEIYDPAGGAFLGKSAESETVLKELLTCDVGIVFLPAEILLEAQAIDVEDDDEFESAWDRIAGMMSLGPIVDAINKIDQRLETRDTFPLTAVRLSIPSRAVTPVCPCV